MHWLALGLSFSGGVAIGFVLTRMWVFHSQSPAWRQQLLRFILVIGLMYLVNGMIMEGLYLILPAFTGRSLFVRGLAATASLPISFTLHRRVSFA